MKKQDQQTCFDSLNTIMLMGNYLEALSMLEEEQLKCCSSPYAFETAARLIKASERELYGSILDDDSDEERQAKLSKTPEQRAKEEQRWADMERSSKAFSAITPLLSSDPDFFIQLAQAFKKDPESMWRHMAEVSADGSEDAGKPEQGGAA